MTAPGKFTRFLKKAWKPVGLILAPLVFAFIIISVAMAVLSVSFDDIASFGSVMLLKKDSTDYGMTEFLDPTLYTDGDNRATIDISRINFPKYEEVYGEIIIDSVGIQCPLIYGDTDAALRRGACQYIGSRLIGYPGTTLVAAHVNRHFAQLHNVKVGDEIRVNTTYGSYVYKATDVFTAMANDKSAFDLTREDENLVLYTCYYEQTALGSVKKRFFVQAEYVSGPVIG